MKIEHFWAKTSQTSEKAFHPLICHLIDVAVVTRKIWQDVLPIATKKRINEAFGIDDAENLIAFIAGLHDLGKCSPPFTLRGLNELRGQTKQLISVYRKTEFWSATVEKSSIAPHGYVTAVELPKILETLGFNQKLSQQISIMIGGHHGIFPSSQKLNDLKLEGYIGKPIWAEARIKLAKQLAELLKIKLIHLNPESKLDNGTIMILAGLVSVADWIGSDTQFFDCAVEDFTVENFGLKQGSLEKYLEHAEVQANKALNQLGWIFPKTNIPQFEEKSLSNEEKFRKLFPFITDRRHLQDMAIEIAEELTSPGIAVIESPMGEGKTEAAMFLAETWNSNLDQNGYYFALPTQATSNQMFGRVERFLKGCFPNRDVHLQLMHGHASLSAEFETLKRNHKSLLQGVFDDECKDENCTPNVVAAEWFTYRKRGLLAPFGVGTVDQALMAVLQTKHVFVRLFGLAHKTIIIDEVHAYDAYMSTLLERLLEWLAALGSPVILLSATLPKNRRDALVKAYQRGLGITDIILEGEDKYPRISYATDSIIKIRNIDVSTKTQTLQIENIREILVKETKNSYKIDNNFINNLKTKLKDGGCVAIICNTVGRSQEIYEQLSKDEFFADKIDLLHSRFRFCDRETRERRVLERFGKPDENDKSPKRPKCAVLIATQIIEQSLDIDFDLMISDLAPIDLLLQRAGRLHRHERIRSSEFKDATLWIIQPEMEEVLPDFGVHKLVYDEHILLRSWLKLQSVEQIEIPSEIETLIESVYDNKLECFDEQFQIRWDETKSEMKINLGEKRLKAKHCRITDADDEDLFDNVSLQLDEENPEAHKDFQALTRDTDLPSVSIVVLTYEEAKNIDFNAEINDEMKKFLLMREAKISKKGLTNKIIADENLKEKSWKTSALLRHHRLLKLDENNEIIIDNFKVSLDEKLGILTEKTGGKNE